MKYCTKFYLKFFSLHSPKIQGPYPRFKKEMDEWDEFLSKANESHSSVSISDKNVNINLDTNLDIGMVKSSVSTLPDPKMIQEPADLGEFGDNAEVLMQMARGESLNQLSNGGIWLNSTAIDTTTLNNFKGVSDGVRASMMKKRALKSMTASSSSIPVANSLQDLSRALTGNPLLSYPLSQLKTQSLNHQIHLHLLQNVSAYEVDSLGLFFYGAPETVKIESNVQDDMKKGLEIKRSLLNQNLLQIPFPLFLNNENKKDETIAASPCAFTISYENFKMISNSIPPNGKSSWLIPFKVNSDASIDISLSAIVPDFCSSEFSLFFEFCSRAIISASAAGNLLNEQTEHLITIDEGLKFLVKTKAPACTIAINFRGSQYIDPSQESVSSLFYRQSNYSIEVDFETFSITSLKSFVPKFDEQSRSFMLLKALQIKLSKLKPGEYFLAHIANTPFIKIITLNHNPADDSSKVLNSFNLDYFFKI